MSNVVQSVKRWVPNSDGPHLSNTCFNNNNLLLTICLHPRCCDDQACSCCPCVWCQPLWMT